MTIIGPRGWGYVAAAWCGLFAVLHLYWALGGSLGLASSAGTELAASRPLWFVAGGLGFVALILLIGAAFCVGLARAWWWGWPRLAVTVLGYAGGGLLLVRGLLLEVVLATGSGGVAATVGPLETRWSLVLWDPWFVLGGLVVLAATWRLARARS